MYFCIYLLYLHLLCVLLCAIETIIVSLCANKDIIIIKETFHSTKTKIATQGNQKISTVSAICDGCTCVMVIYQP